MNVPKVDIKQLLEAGVHLGHKTLRWNPKMKKYIFGEKNSIHIIDLTQTVEFLKNGASLLALVKPQFEAGANEVGKRGRVSDPAIHKKVLEKLKNAAEELGLIVSGQTKSVIAGKKSGNEEYLLWLQKPN